MTLFQIIDCELEIVPEKGFPHNRGFNCNVERAAGPAQSADIVNRQEAANITGDNIQQ